MRSMMRRAVLFLILLFVSVSNAISWTEIQEFGLITTIRRWWGGGPCSKNNRLCMNRMMLYYVNDYRRRLGIRPLRMGTLAMYNNAFQHSKDQASKRRLFHQNLRGINRARNFSCGSYLSGENVAQNYVPYVKNIPSNPAFLCWHQWRNSANHYRNMMHPFHKQTVLAIYIDPGDLIWCTQLFATSTKFGSGECAPALGTPYRNEHLRAWPSPSPTPPPTPSPKPSRSPRPPNNPSQSQHTFKYQRVRVRYKSGVSLVLVLKCNQGVCKYCLITDTRRCYSTSISIYIDKYLTSMYG